MIKRLLLLIVIVGATCYAQAQITKGSLFIGGSAQFQNQKMNTENSSNDSKSTSVSITPAFGTFIKDNLVIGLSLSYSNSKTRNTNIEQNNGHSFGGGAFLRRYMLLGKGFFFFTEMGAGLYVFKNDYQMGSPFKRLNGYTVNLGIYPGISYAINSKIHIESGFNSLVYLSYNKSKYLTNSQEKVTYSTFNLGTSLSNPISLSVGIRFILNK